MQMFDLERVDWNALGTHTASATLSDDNELDGDDDVDDADVDGDGDEYDDSDKEW